MNKLLIKSLPTRRSSDLDVEQFGAVGAHHELALARAPDRALAVIADRDDAGMRLDIALMHGLARITALDREDRKSTRLNSSHRCISYAFFCLKKKNTE